MSGMQSIWHENVGDTRFPVVHGDIKTDVLVIGGGIAGVLCTYMLKGAGVDCVLVEADRIGSGITQNTTAKVTLQHGLLYNKLIRRFGWERANLYLNAHREAAGVIERLCAAIPCEYEKKDAYVYALDDRQCIEKELEALQSLGCDADFSEAPRLPFRVAGAVRVPDQAQLHPLKFITAIARDLPIYEHTKVQELMPGRARTGEGNISFQKAIVATHFPILNKHGGYYLKLYQHRSYVLALGNAGNVDGMYVDASGKGLSLRNCNDLLLLGGGGHRTGKHGGSFGELEGAAHRYYPTAHVTARWAAQDCMSLDSVPYIGQYARSTPNLFVATGFNKWGMTSSMVAAMLLCDLVQDRPSPYVEVFSPSRSILRPQLALNAFEAVTNLLTPTAPRCPHLGCALKYNKAEHSWDCPCHGSRFTEDGELIDNPATDDHPGLHSSKL